ncbi:MAG: hypothetical protein J6R67_03145 [Treponema sp.]|nr:hypothetical protein [Treponema sp.]
MKTMRIGSSIINLDAIYDINCVEREKGTGVRVEYSHSIKEYLVPGFFVPEIVATAIQRGMNDEDDSFDLMANLTAFTKVLE